MPVSVKILLWYWLRKCSVSSQRKSVSSSGNSARQYQQNPLRLEPATGDVSEQITTNLQNDGDTSSCSSSEDEGGETLAKEDAAEFSGIEVV